MAGSHHSRTVPVLLAGAGPAGLVGAVTLARHGVGSLLVERNPGLSPLPRATGVSVRTMELLRSFGLEGQVRAGEVAMVEAGAWTTETLASPDGVMFPSGFPSRRQVAAVSPTMLAAVPQDHLEPVLLAHLRSHPTAEVRFATELVGFDQDGEGVTATLRDVRSGASTVVRARYLVGGDGAHSGVRAALGVGMDGPDHLAEHLTVLFQAPLGEVVGERRYGIYFIQHPEAAGVLVPSGAGDRWLYGRRWRPDRERLEDYTEARLTGLLRAATGVPGLRPRILAMGAFSFAAQVADRYRAGNVFLVGDAAHRMTPRGAMGMNTAIGDGYDLGWKLAWVLRGWAGPELLDSYEAERRPLGRRRTARSAADGPEPDGAEWLAEDLGGRVAHAWLRRDGRRVSTLDLLGPGLTLFTGPDAAAWQAAAAAVDMPAPLAVRPLDRAAAGVVGIGGQGAALVRPDGQVATRWPTPLPDAEAELRRAVARLAAPAPAGVAGAG
jgi:putative polyketide hydroxylase